jgi:hypothetical protein
LSRHFFESHHPKEKQKEDVPALLWGAGCLFFPYKKTKGKKIIDSQHPKGALGHLQLKKTVK